MSLLCLINWLLRILNFREQINTSLHMWQFSNLSYNTKTHMQVQHNIVYNQTRQFLYSISCMYLVYSCIYAKAQCVGFDRNNKIYIDKTISLFHSCVVHFVWTNKSVSMKPPGWLPENPQCTHKEGSTAGDTIKCLN